MAYISDKDINHVIKIDNEEILNSTEEKILGVYFDNKLNFNDHVKKLDKKASQKLHALARLSNFMSIRQRIIIMNAFINSQFSYCPLIWMSHSRTINSLVNNIHKRALRIAYKDHKSSFAQLLEKSGTTSIHHKNLQIFTPWLTRNGSVILFPIFTQFNFVILFFHTWNVDLISCAISSFLIPEFNFLCWFFVLGM